MRKLVVLTAAALFYLSGAETAQAHLVTRPGCETLKCRLKSQEHNLAHAEYVARNGERRFRTWHRRWVTILEREIAETRHALRPRLSLREWIRRNDPCGYEVINRETGGTWSPTIANPYSGAYGWPQALPARKMASAGADYMTNPRTQYEWFKGYVNSRYGGSCGALAFHNANGWY